MLEAVELENALAVAFGFGALATAIMVASFLLAWPGARMADGAKAVARPASTKRTLPPELMSL